MVRDLEPKELGKEEIWNNFRNTQDSRLYIGAELDVTRMMEFREANKGKYPLNALLLYAMVLGCDSVPETRLIRTATGFRQFDKATAHTVLLDGDDYFYCHIPFNGQSLNKFVADYNHYKQYCIKNRRSNDGDYTDCATYAMSNVGAFGLRITMFKTPYTERFPNPFMMVSAIEKHDNGKYTVNVSFSFQHECMNSKEGIQVLAKMQRVLNEMGGGE